MNTRRTALAALTLPLALTFAACGEDDGDDRSNDTAAPAAAPTPASTTEASSGAPATATPAADDAALLAAAGTAAGAVPGGTLLSLDLEAAGWEAEVADDDAASFDLALSADGADVTREPVEDRDDADDTDDLAERRDLVAGATVDPAAAVEAVRSAATTGTIDGLDLDLSAGTVVWEVQLDEDSATEQTVTVDAGTGEILQTEQDD